MKKRMDSLQALRALACLCIFAHHSGYNRMVYWGVSLFLVLSGFLMTVSYYDKYDGSLHPLHCLRFSAKKLARLYPLHILTMLPVVALDLYMLRAHQAYSWAHILGETAANVLLVQSWTPRFAMTLNGVAWYLSTSLFLYFAFPYILHAIRAYRSRRRAYGAIAVLYALELVLAAAAQALGRAICGGAAGGFLSWFGYIFPLYRCIDFAIGCNLGFLFLTEGEAAKSPRATVLLEAACVLLFAASAWIFYRTDCFLACDPFKPAALYLPFCALCVLLFARGRGLLPKLLTNRVTVFFGNISAAFFLIHQDILRPLYMLLDRFGLSYEQSRPLLFFLGGGIAVGLSVLYGKLEKAVQLRRRRTLAAR